MCTSLTIAGGTLEAVGLYITARELLATERREFPERQHLVRRALAGAVARVRRYFAPEPQAHTVHLTGRASATGGAHGIVTTGHAGPPRTLEERLADLERLVDALGTQTRKDLAELRGELQRGDREVLDALGALEAEIETREQRRRDYLGESLTREKTGLMLLAIGLTVSTLGGAITC